MLDMETVDLNNPDENEKLWTLLTFAEDEGLDQVILPVVCKLNDQSMIVMGGTCNEEREDGTGKIQIADSYILKLSEDATA